jgi:hypothetical protein
MQNSKKLMKTLFLRCLKGAAVALLATIINLNVTSATAAPNATGVWKWTATGQNNQSYDATLKLKQDGDKITGAMVGRTGTETAIEAGKIQEDAISFQVTRERNGQSSTTKYTGKLSGDTIKGSTESERNGQTRTRDWEAKREAAPANATGTWKWTFTPQNGQAMDSTLQLKQQDGKLTGTLTGRRGETAIEDGKINGAEVSFTVTRERNGEKFVAKYAGTINGDTIKGKIEMGSGDQARSRDWEAKRETTADVSGTWQWTMTRPNGETTDRKIKLKQDGDKLTGVSIWNDTETAIENGQVKEGEVSFQVTREFNGNKFTMNYKGKADGDSLKGKIDGTFGGEARSFDWDAKRVKE